MLDDSPLRALARDTVVLSVRDHFFRVGETPHLALVVEYRLPAPSTPDGSSGRRRPGQGADSTEDLRAKLPTDQRETFDLLRAWRAGTARDESVPAYAILTNAQLVELASRHPRTRAALAKVPGLGSKRAERHGAAILKVLGRDSHDDSSEP